MVGRSPQVRDRNDTGAFVVFSEPMPVGSAISFKIDDKEQFARVTEVVESADAAAAGMRVRFVSAAERSAPATAPMARVAAAPAAPPPAVVAAPPPAPAVEPAAHADAPIPVAAEASSASQAVAAGSQAHQADPNAPHHDGEGGRRRRRRK